MLNGFEYDRKNGIWKITPMDDFNGNSRPDVLDKLLTRGNPDYGSKNDYSGDTGDIGG